MTILELVVIDKREGARIKPEVPNLGREIRSVVICLVLLLVGVL